MMENQSMTGWAGGTVKRRDVIQGLGAIVAQSISPGLTRVAGAQTKDQSDTGKASAADLVPPPNGGLTSNSNYFLYSDGNPITGLSITIEITKDLVAAHGVNMQWNAYSDADANANWMQYCLGFDPVSGPKLKVGWSVEYWPSKTYHQQLTKTVGLPIKSDLFNQKGALVTLPMPSAGVTIPAGFKSEYTLAYDSNGNVTGVTVVVTDNHGKSTSSGLRQLKTFKFDHTKSMVTADAMVAILAFEMNIVGLNASRYSFVKSGAGKITYKAAVPMTVQSKQPKNISAEGVGTAETSNIAYGQLQAGPSNEFTQTFEAAEKPIFRPGGPFAVSQRFDVTDQTDFYVISIQGQLIVFSVKGNGRWTQSPAYGVIDMAVPHTFIAASKRFGTDNQTDVFLIDQSEQLQVFVASPTGLTGPTAIGAKNFAARGGPIAVARQLNAIQTNVFVFDNGGQLNVFAGPATAAWQGPVKVGPPGFAAKGAQLAASQLAATNQSAVFAVDTTGTLCAFRSTGASSWQGPEKISKMGFAKSGGHVAVAPRAGSPNQTDVYLVDKKGQLSVFSAQGTASFAGPAAIGPTDFATSGAPIAVAMQSGGAQTDVFVTDRKGALQLFSISGDSDWSGPLQIGEPGITTSGAYIAASPQFGVAHQYDIFFINQTGTKAPGWPVVMWGPGTNSWTGPKALVAEV
jgi:hypothetical protein